MDRWDVVRAGHAGDRDLARAALHDPDPALRASALSALVRLDQLTRTDLTQALADPHPAVRVSATWAAARHSLGTDPDVSAAIIDLLGDTDAAVCEAAAFALGETEADRAVNALASVASTHPDALCREAAIAALGCIGAEAGLDAVLGGLDDIATVRRRTVIALANFDTPEAEEALQRARADRDIQVRQSAEDLTRDTPPAPAQA